MYSSTENWGNYQERQGGKIHAFFSIAQWTFIR